MNAFVKEKSIVRTVWSDTDCILFIFGACAGEFAHSKSVDWLFYTGKLPNDPIGRLFSTVGYAHQIIFQEDAQKTLVRMTQIHKNVEKRRGYSIPNWAYQDVLYMLVDYTISVYELLHKPLSSEDKSEVYDVFKRIGEEMEVKDLPDDWELWKPNRKQHLTQNYAETDLTKELFKRYKTHLGAFRFTLLQVVQSFLLPSQFLEKRHNPVWKCIFIVYKWCKAYWPIKNLKYYLLPKEYQETLRGFSSTGLKRGCPFSKLTKPEFKIRELAASFHRIE